MAENKNDRAIRDFLVNLCKPDPVAEREAFLANRRFQEWLTAEMERQSNG